MPGRAVFSLLHREIRGLHEAAYILAFFTLGSQVFALLRDRLLAHTFGTGETLDLFYAAFKIPDVLYAVLASMVSLFVLIPFLEDARRNGEDAVRDFLSHMFSFFSGALLLFGACAWVFTPQIISFLYGGFTYEMQETLVPIVRILLLQPLLLGVSNLFAAYVQVRGRFLLYAIAPILYNIGIIFGITVLYPNMGNVGLAWGVVLGALLHVGIQTPFMLFEHALPRFRMPDWSTVKSVVRVSIPRTITLSAQQVAMLVLVSFMTPFAVGSVSAFSLAWNLQAVPLALIGASYSVAAFPRLARLFGTGELDKYRDLIISATQQIIFWALPATVLVVVLRAHIVRVIFGTGAFNWDATMMTGAILALLVASLVAQSLVVLLVRACYAAGKTMVPLLLNVGSSVLIVLGAYILVYGAHIGHIDLGAFAHLMRVGNVAGGEALLVATAYSIGSFINAILLLLYFEITLHRVVRKVARTFLEAVVASLIAGLVAYGALNTLDDYLITTTSVGIFLQGLGAGLLGIFAWFLALVSLGSKDLEDAWGALHRRYTRGSVGATRGSIEVV